MTWRRRWKSLLRKLWWRIRYGRDGYAIKSLKVDPALELGGHKATALVIFSDALLRDVERHEWLPQMIGEDLGHRLTALLREDDLPNVSH